MHFKLIRLIPWFLTCVITSALATTAAVDAPSKLKYDSKQSATAVEVVYRLYAGHYNKRRVDDALSEDFLERYLTMLDPSRMYLYKKDVDGLKAHTMKFDDYFREGNLDVAYQIYAMYQARVKSRLQNLIDTLEDETVEYKFTGNDEINLDREEAPWATSISESDELWHKRIKWSLLSLKMAGKTIEEARETVAKRYKNQLNRVNQEKSEDVFEVVLNALTVLFDPHTNYWLPRTTENFNINMSKSLEGIGAVLQTEDEFTKIVRLVTGGPADREGKLKAADRIVAVGQGNMGEMVDIVGWRLDDVVKLIRGPKNTVVRLDVLPSGEGVGGTTTTISINRGKVTLEDQAAQKAILELPGEKEVRKLGVIHLPDFYIDFDAASRRDPNYKSSTRDVKRLIDELKTENIDGMILDLRNNGGGSLQEATMLTDLFIDRGVVVQIKSSDGRVGRHNQARMQPAYDGPLVVLINRLSASASEIFAGAIQDYGRGLIIGSQSFGKGTVQSVKDLKHGHLKITESKFYRVSGDSTQHRGVIPDIRFPSLIDVEEVGESAYENALPWDQIHAVPHTRYNNFSVVIPALKAKHLKRISDDPDFNYLINRIDFIKENQKRTTLSLNEKRRQERKDSLELTSMQLENTRLIAKGMEPYKDLKDFRTKEKEKESDSQAYKPNKIDVDGDTLLIESGNILIDMVDINAAQPKSQKLAGSVQ